MTTFGVVMFVVAIGLLVMSDVETLQGAAAWWLLGAAGALMIGAVMIFGVFS